MKFILILGLSIFFLCAQHALAENGISARFVPWPSTAALSGQWALWHNPAGLAFFSGAEHAIAYLYEWRELGNRHHGGANLAFNLWDSLSLGLGLNARAASSEQPTNDAGSHLNGIFGTAVSLDDMSSVGISFMKSYNFSQERNRSTMVSFGFQSRLSKAFSMGGLYQEVHDGFFTAPDLYFGLAARPAAELVTLSLDGRLSALSPKWDNYRLDPIFGVKGQKGGFALSLTTEIPGIKDGWLKPRFLMGMELNFAHIGFNVAGLVDKSGRNYGAGGSLRMSSAEWSSLRTRTGYWVDLNVSSDGSFETERPSWATRLFGIKENPLRVLALLKRMKSDPSISGVIIRIKGFDFGDARAQEWHEALQALRRANKQVVVFLESPTERDYYVATAANKIYMNPYATLSFTRFQNTLVYFADLLKKIGVRAEAVTAGTYKTAVRPFTNSSAQKEEIEIYTHILQSFYKDLLEKASQARSIDQHRLKAIFDTGTITATTAKEAGLVDELIFKDELEDVAGDGQELALFANYEHRTFKREGWAPPKKIVVIPITGEIAKGRVFPTLLPLFGRETGSADVEDAIASAVADPNVVAIIVRIDSPGGIAEAGEDINRALQKAQEEKPVIASMGDVAASAGYMIAAGATHITAERDTITGSIGVFSLYFSGEELARKIGVNTTELSPLKNPGPTVFRTLSTGEREQAQKITDWVYQNFINTVASGLELDAAYVKKNADGRVWLGYEAFAKKLVNELGGFSAALDAARLYAEIPPEEELEITILVPGGDESLSINARLIDSLKSTAMLHDLARIKTMAQPYIKALEAYRLSGIPQARLPFDFIRANEAP